MMEGVGSANRERDNDDQDGRWCIRYMRMRIGVEHNVKKRVYLNVINYLFGAYLQINRYLSGIRIVFNKIIYSSRIRSPISFK